MWFHTVMVYNGPLKGIIIYVDGQLVGKDTDGGTQKYDENVRRLVIGRRSSDEDEDYASAVVDELMFWNRRLTSEDVEEMYSHQYSFMIVSKPDDN